MTGPSSASLLRFKNEIGAGFELPGLKVVASPLKMPFLMALMPLSNGSPFAAVPLLSCCGPFQFGAPAFLYAGPPLMVLEDSLTLPDVLCYVSILRTHSIKDNIVNLRGVLSRALDGLPVCRQLTVCRRGRVNAHHIVVGGHLRGAVDSCDEVRE